MESSNSLSGLASIIIPGCKPLELIRPCITALRRYTRRPWELIVIDDGSSDEMSTYLESVRDAVSVPVTVITNVTSRGIAAAINQGLKAARGEYLVLLNNDVVVTDGFTGNVALKTMEGVAGLIADRLRQEFQASLLDKLAGLVARPVLRRAAASLDPRRYNGACMVGLAGIVVKSHGHADGVAFARAIGTAALAVRRDLTQHIAQALQAEGTGS